MPFPFMERSEFFRKLLGWLFLRKRWRRMHAGEGARATRSYGILVRPGSVLTRSL
jgi:hypothetical protein